MPDSGPGECLSSVLPGEASTLKHRHACLVDEGHHREMAAFSIFSPDSGGVEVLQEARPPESQGWRQAYIINGLHVRPTLHVSPSTSKGPYL